MSQWSEGYVNDIGYTFGYYSELNPSNATIPFLMAGVSPPSTVTACELGFGQGLSVNIHSSASSARWHGTDFNPCHTQFAQKCSNVSGNSAQLFDQSFSEFCSRDDLPDFDFIGVHGIWSWISDENRQTLIEFFKKKLKVGGVLYISYNTLPGWSAAAPVRHIMAEHAHTLGAKGEGSLTRVSDSLKFTQELIGLCHSYKTLVPSITEKVKDISSQDPHYLAHEYFNRDWKPMYFSEMAESLTTAKLDYVCSSRFLNDFSASNFTPEQSEFLNNISNNIFAESTKDFMRNTQFRKDYWVKGARKLSSIELEQHWDALKILMLKDANTIVQRVSGSVGTFELKPEVYRPIIDFLNDHEVHTVQEVRSALESELLTAGLIFQAIALLQSKEDIIIIQSDAAIIESTPRCNKLNQYIMNESMVNNNIGVLASPLTGGAIGVNRINQLFIKFYLAGHHTEAELADQVWKTLVKAGHRIVKKQKTLDTEQENIAELQTMASAFLSKELDLFQKLLICPTTVDVEQ